MTQIDLWHPAADYTATQPGITRLFCSQVVTMRFDETGPLRESLTELGLDDADFAPQSAALTANDSQHGPQSTGTMMDYVLRRDHQTHRRDLVELILLADKVKAAHAHSPTARKAGPPVWSRSKPNLNRICICKAQCFSRAFCNKTPRSHGPGQATGRPREFGQPAGRTQAGAVC